MAIDIKEGRLIKKHIGFFDAGNRLFLAVFAAVMAPKKEGI